MVLMAEVFLSTKIERKLKKTKHLIPVTLNFAALTSHMSECSKETTQTYPETTVQSTVTRFQENVQTSGAEKNDQIW